MSRDCPACGNPLLPEAAAARLRASNGTPVDYTVCRHCGLMLQDPLWNEAELAPFYARAYYGQGETKFPGWLEWIRERGQRNAARKLNRWISSGSAQRGRSGAVLDVGCGSGAFLDQVRRLGWDIYGTELAGPACERAARIPEIHLLQGPLRADSFAPEQFVAITLWHVLEHLPNPGEVLAWCRRWLRADGWLVVEVPNLGSWQAKLFRNFWMHLDPPRHQYQFTPQALERMMARAGFEVVRRETCSAQMGIFGALQSALNVCMRPPNFLYELLLARGRLGAGWVKKAVTVLLSALLLPLALLCWAAESLAGRGAVLRCVCRPG